MVISSTQATAKLDFHFIAADHTWHTNRRIESLEIQIPNRSSAVVSLPKNLYKVGIGRPLFQVGGRTIAWIKLEPHEICAITMMANWMIPTTGIRLRERVSLRTDNVNYKPGKRYELLLHYANEQTSVTLRGEVPISCETRWIVQQKELFDIIYTDLRVNELVLGAITKCQEIFAIGLISLKEYPEVAFDEPLQKFLSGEIAKIDEHDLKALLLSVRPLRARAPQDVAAHQELVSLIFEEMGSYSSFCANLREFIQGFLKTCVEEPLSEQILIEVENIIRSTIL